MKKQHENSMKKKLPKAFLPQNSESYIQTLVCFLRMTKSDMLL